MNLFSIFHIQGILWLIVNQLWITHRSKYDKEARKKVLNGLRTEYIKYFDAMYHDYCKSANCSYYCKQKIDIDKYKSYNFSKPI